MSHSKNENEYENFLDIENFKFNESLRESVNVDFRNLIQSNPESSSKKESLLMELECENKNLKENSFLLLEENQNLQTTIAVQELTIKKNEEKVNILLQENFKLKSAFENYEEMKKRLNTYEKLIDLQSLSKSSSSANEQQQVITGFMEKLKVIETDNQTEVIELKRIIARLKMQIDNYTGNNNNYNNNVSNNHNNTNNTDFNFLLNKKEEELVQLRSGLAKAEFNVDFKDKEIYKVLAGVEEFKAQIVKLNAENADLKFNLQSKDHTINNINNLNSLNNLNSSILSSTNNSHSECVKAITHHELKTKFFDFLKIHEVLKEELESEKTKYISLLQMNQDLGKKIIENLKIINENKSEITYLKSKVAEQQKEKSEHAPYNASFFDDLGSNFELNLLQEDRRKANEVRLSLEKQLQEQKIQIVELTQTIKHSEMRIQSLLEELNLEKMENENLKEIQKSDLKNISKMLSEQSSQNQGKKNEVYISELKVSLQNTNKINEELAKQKKDLEKEISDIKNKFKEQQNAFLTLSNERDPNNYNAFFRDDKSQAAFSRFSMQSNLTQNKFLDSKIRDLEDSLVQEKENAENLLKIKQSLINKLKQSNETLIAERNKLNKDLSEEKMKNKSLQMEKNTLLESEEYLKVQVQELNAEACDLRIYQDNYELIEEKLEEFQKQFKNIVSNYNNPQIQNENFQKLVNENVELNAYKNQYLVIESDLQEKNKELYALKEKCFYMEQDLNLAKQVQTHGLYSSNASITNFNSHNSSNNNELLVKELENKIKSLEEENKELNQSVEDSKLIIFSLREKCKDVIAKEKEILRLNNVINDLNERRKKRVSFGKDILVEFRKEGSPSEQGNEIKREFNNSNNINNSNYNNNQIQKPNFNNNNYNYNNINDLLKSQQDLYQKYHNELNNIRSVQPSFASIDINNFGKSDALENKNSKIEHEDTDSNSVHVEDNNNTNNNNNINNNGNYHLTEAKGEVEVNENIQDIYRDMPNTNDIDHNENNNNNRHHSHTDEAHNNLIICNNQPQQIFNNMNTNTMISEILSAPNQRGEDMYASLNIPKIEIGNIDILSALGSNLDSEFSRIKNKYKLNDGDSDVNVNNNNFNSIIPTIKDSLDLRGINKTRIRNTPNKLNETNNIPDFMSRSHVSQMNIIDRILAENSISLDSVGKKADSSSNSINEQQKAQNNLSNSAVIIVNSKNHLILREDLNEIPLTNEIEIKQEDASADAVKEEENNEEK